MLVGNSKRKTEQLKKAYEGSLSSLIVQDYNSSEKGLMPRRISELFSKRKLILHYREPIISEYIHC
jgi:hypothetical protein